MKGWIHVLEMGVRTKLLRQIRTGVSRFPPYHNSEVGVYARSGALFYPTPKNATSSIHLLFLYADGYAGRKELQTPDFGVYNFLERAPHPTRKRRCRVTRREKKSLVKFSFVRNPFERLVSFYVNKINPPDGEFLDLYMNPFYPGINFQEMDFPDFAHFVSELPERRMNPHFLPQRYFFTPQKMDFIGRVENFSRDMERLTSLLKPEAQKKIAGARLPRLKKSEHRHYTEYYDEKIRRLVEKIYANDIQMFGYRFGD